MHEWQARLQLLSSDLCHYEELKKVPVNNSDGRKDDITLFLEDRLAQIARVHVGEREKDWPGKDKLRELILKIDGLWVYASTVYLFLNDSNAMKRLDYISEDLVDEGTPQHELNTLYRKIIEAPLLKVGTLQLEKDAYLNSFKQVVGAIVIALDCRFGPLVQFSRL